MRISQRFSWHKEAPQVFAGIGHFASGKLKLGLLLAVFLLLNLFQSIAITSVNTVGPAACDLNNDVSSISYHIRPSSDELKVKPKALITLYTSPDSATTAYDTHFSDTLLMAHTFSQLNHTQDVEFVVGHTGTIPEPHQTSLIRLGARLLLLPALEHTATGSHKPCVACFSKIHLFGLQNIYSSILYMDSNILLSNDLDLAALFAHSNRDGYFGAVASLAFGPTKFDSSVLLFAPSISRMNRMIDSVSECDLSAFFLDQDFFNTYFSAEGFSACSSWSRLPDTFNFQNAAIRRPTQVSKASVIQHDFWNIQATYAAVPVFEQWKTDMRTLFDYQVAQWGRSDVGIVPESFDDWQVTLRANTFASTFVILTILPNGTESHVFNRTVKNRQNYISFHPQVSHFVETEVTARNAVWQKAHTAERLAPHFDWIWLLDGRNAMIMNKTIDLRVLIGKLVIEATHLVAVDVIIAKDLGQAFNAGSFFLRCSEWTKTIFFPQWKLHEPDEHMSQEQWAMVRMYDDKEVETEKHLYELPQIRQNLFNSYNHGPEPRYTPGDLVVHSPWYGWVFLYNYLEEMGYVEI
ncbi:hypothetical protein HDU98_012294 [Podochytrium sp. JEL0797]|nr:hypothetical protein HDU98_012294 [Podochytrium sp. JEL0797]